MSATKDFLYDPANLSAETRRGLAHDDPEIVKIIQGILIRKRIRCNDGFTMSVQYSRGHYCNGRERFMGGEMEPGQTEYPEPTHVEVGLPNRKDKLLKPYAEEWAIPTGTVYGWVPVEVVDQVIARHGGIKEVY